MLRILEISGSRILGCGLALALFLPFHDARAEMVLYSFTGGNDGAAPAAGPIADSAGNLYGTTVGGGGNRVCQQGIVGCGTVFKLASDGTESVLYKFCSKRRCRDGAEPAAGLIADSAGNLYGTTEYGGATDCIAAKPGCGTVFKIAPDGTEKVLYSFTGGSDGGLPAAGLIEDSAGNLYGTTSQGGIDTKCNDEGCGTVFKIAPDGTETVLYYFCAEPNCRDGAGPVAGLIADSAGNLYGTTFAGGRENSAGIVFKVTPADFTEKVLYSFTGGNDGGGPRSSLIRDRAGNLYGTTEYGGVSGTHNDGAVFKVAPDRTETVLYSFCAQADCRDGWLPAAGLIADSVGNLYGTTLEGGEDNFGIVYRLALDGTYKVLHSFTGGSDGGVPAGGLIAGTKGYLYGTTSQGGTNVDCDDEGCGTVFELKK
jgi:uncharacterized repeat protein (TIGR03803 family)